MLTISVPTQKMYDEEKGEFVFGGFVTLELEHSLVSLSKWESQYEKAFLGKQEKTEAEVLGYVKAMTLTPDVPDEVFFKLSAENIDEINAYINKKMTATHFVEPPGAPQTRDVITAELIYYWMTVFNIPFECENWHLNRLFSLIRVCNIKQAKPKKTSPAEAAAQRRELNARRRAQLGSKG